MRKLLELRDARNKFALDHHRNTRGEPIEFQMYPYIKELYNSLSPIIVLQGSVQSLKTEFIIIDHLAAAYTGLAVFFVVSKVEARTTFVQNRIDRCIERVDFYKNLTGAASFDNVVMKNFGKGVIKYVGSNAPSDFKEFPADMAYIDEVDECDAENVKYAVDRLKASRYQFRRYVGNPTFDGQGIAEFYRISNQKKWNVPCKSCGEYHEIDWFTTVVNPIKDKAGEVVGYSLRDKEWKIGCGRDTNLICPSCGGVLDRASQEGKWIANNPTSEIDGYHISRLHNPLSKISELWMLFQDAQGDPVKLKHFYNSELGITFKGIGYQITLSMLDDCTDPNYEFVVDSNAAFCPYIEDYGGASMGIDIGGNQDIRISKNVNGKRRMLYVGKIKSLSEANGLIDKYGVEMCVIDAGPETSMVKDFQEEATCQVWLCRYHKTEGDAQKMRLDYSDRIITVDRTFAMDKAYTAIKKKRNILPRNFRSFINGKYVEEICGPVKELVQDSHGNLRYVWKKCEDHARHADVYDLLADEILQGSTISEVFVT